MWDAERSLTVVGTVESSTAPEQNEKKALQDENSPPEGQESAKLEQITKLLGTVSSPSRKMKRKLAGRARGTATSSGTLSALSPEDEENSSEGVPKPTQEKVEYKDPIAEREMAKIVANLTGVKEDGKNSLLNDGMTPAENIGRRGSRRKVAKK
jgi:hypothetical protein